VNERKPLPPTVIFEVRGVGRGRTARGAAVLAQRVHHIVQWQGSVGSLIEGEYFVMNTPHAQHVHHIVHSKGPSGGLIEGGCNGVRPMGFD
jgi:hypothetical protein